VINAEQDLPGTEGGKREMMGMARGRNDPNNMHI
jgi:hypothetical protein